jgi:N-acylneuraminate cytidylyltransferase
MTDKKIIAVIPARGGSKGVPGKNVRPLTGKPLIAHTIEQAHRSEFVKRVVVSTDSPGIAVVAQQYGAEVVWRPAEISGDSASSESALLHTLEQLRQREEYQPDLLVFLQCTSPLTLAADIDGTVQELLDKKADSALAVTPFHYFLWRHDNNGDAAGINHDKQVRLLRQEREPEYLETGAIYVMRADGFMQAKHRFFGRTAIYVMPPERCLEIDEPVDFQVAEMLLRQRQAQEKEGREAVWCHGGDGWGIARLQEAGVEVVVLSSETNPVVAARCRKVGLACLQGCPDKLATLRGIARELSLTPEKIAYVGSDINDLDCLQWVGLPIAVADAYPPVQSAARLITTQPGGHGAVREVCDLILTQKQASNLNQSTPLPSQNSQPPTSQPLNLPTF